MCICVFSLDFLNFTFVFLELLFILKVIFAWSVYTDFCVKTVDFTTIAIFDFRVGCGIFKFSKSLCFEFLCFTQPSDMVFSIVIFTNERLRAILRNVVVALVIVSASVCYRSGIMLVGGVLIPLLCCSISFSLYSRYEIFLFKNSTSWVLSSTALK